MGKIGNALMAVFVIITIVSLLAALIPFLSNQSTETGAKAIGEMAVPTEVNIILAAQNFFGKNFGIIFVVSIIAIALIYKLDL